MESNPLDLYDRLVRFARHLGADLEQAKDMVQTAYELYYTYHYEGSNVLYTIIRSRMINYYQSYRPVIVQIDTISAPISYDLDLYDAEYHRKRISRLGLQRKPFELFLQGYDYKEIAELENISMGTVKSRIHTARKRLGV